MSHALTLLPDPTPALPAIVAAAGGAACFAWDEFFAGQVRNPHTRRAYTHAVRRFLAWADAAGVELGRITPGMVGSYLDGLKASVPTRKLHLAALRGFFDALVLRHVVILNPAASVRAARHTVIEGKTPEIAIDQARILLASIDTGNVVGLRDRAAIAVLIYTAARIGAVSKLMRKKLRPRRHAMDAPLRREEWQEPGNPGAARFGALPSRLSRCGGSARRREGHAAVPLGARQDETLKRSGGDGGRPRPHGQAADEEFWVAGTTFTP